MYLCVKMKVPKIPLAQTLVQLCKAKGIKHIIISPGSRNAPLTIGFTNDAFFDCHSIVDERCGAFFALGIAQQIKHPVALVCTSGSALLNYFPAIAEAFYSDIPLVVMSADRPDFLVGIGDGQTIDQKNVYGQHVLYSANLKLDIDEDADDIIEKKEDLSIFRNLENKLEHFLGMQLSIQQHNEKEINLALNTAIASQGPVHINCPFSEPLYDLIDSYSVKPIVKDVDPIDDSMDNEKMEELLAIWNGADRKMILSGTNLPNEIDQEILNRLADDRSVMVLTETTSNMHHKAFFPSIDQLIAPLVDHEFKKLQPDVLVTIGGMIVSKKVKAFLRRFQPKHHWHVDRKKANDTFFCLETHIKKSPSDFFTRLLSKGHISDSRYRDYWTTIQQGRINKHNRYIKTIPFSDLSVFDVVLRSLPDNITLHLGNSSTVRYTQLFELHRTLKVFCNRGTSGIDGSTSTAVGAASISKDQNVLITGDLSFFYDSNALWNNYIPRSFRIIVINNSGGGIFRILPGHKDSENFDQYFETVHGLTAKQLCHMYGIQYRTASTASDLIDELKDFYDESDTPRLLEIMTPRKENDRVLLDYFKVLR